MPTHDCETCSAKGHCPIEGIAPWLNEHEDEVAQASHSCNKELAKACAVLVAAFPPAIMCGEDVVMLVKYGFSLGYHKGKTYQDVPKVFEEA